MLEIKYILILEPLYLNLHYTQYLYLQPVEKLGNKTGVKLKLKKFNVCVVFEMFNLEILQIFLSADNDNAL